MLTEQASRLAHHLAYSHEYELAILELCIAAAQRDWREAAA